MNHQQQTTDTPQITDVRVEQDPEYGWVVGPVWSSVDRPYTGGIATGTGARGKALAARLEAAIRAGVVYVEPSIRVDVNGQSYVNANCRVLGRMLNADLRRLGF